MDESRRHDSARRPRRENAAVSAVERHLRQQAHDGGSIGTRTDDLEGHGFISSLPHTARRLLSRQVGTVQASVSNRRNSVTPMGRGERRPSTPSRPYRYPARSKYRSQMPGCDVSCRALVGCEGDRGDLPIRGVDQPSRHQQQDRENQGIDRRDRDHAHGEAAEMIVEVRA